MQRTNLKNTLSRARNPSVFFVMVKKVFKRFFDSEGTHTQKENREWLESHRSSFNDLAMSLDENLWMEAQEVSRGLERRAEQILQGIEYKLGGGGAFPYLYFITRYLKPDCIVETGVAAGFTSSAILTAIQRNGMGKLFSSDFPYFRIPQPEKYIGIVVEKTLKDDWQLLINGDEINLPKIVAQVEHIDLFHYDSDKSYSGRDFAISLIKGSMSDKGVIIMDDIIDNSWFYDYIEKHKPESWYVFEFKKDQFVGMIGNLGMISG